eukprot:3362806-Alexandrium_andersonii.AAC.1
MLDGALASIRTVQNRDKAEGSARFCGPGSREVSRRMFCDPATSLKAHARYLGPQLMASGFRRRPGRGTVTELF